MNDILLRLVFMLTLATSTVMMAGAALGAGWWLVLMLTGRDLLAVAAEKRCPDCGGEIEVDFDFGDILVIGCWSCGWVEDGNDD